MSHSFLLSPLLAGDRNWSSRVSSGGVVRSDSAGMWRRALPPQRVYSSAVSREQLVSLDEVLTTRDRGTDKPGRFLLPVKGRLQGKRQGCRWGIRPWAGSVRLRRPPAAHAQSLQPPIIQGMTEQLCGSFLEPGSPSPLTHWPHVLELFLFLSTRL